MFALAVGESCGLALCGDLTNWLLSPLGPYPVLCTSGPASHQSQSLLGRDSRLPPTPSQTITIALDITRQGRVTSPHDHLPSASIT